MTGNKKSRPNSITRRDFVGGTLIGSGAALLAAKAPGLLPQAQAQTIAAPLTGLDKSWTGPGGVGDYARANGNTHDVVNAAHTFRNGDFDARVRNAASTGEHYDLVIVGAGFAGVTTAYTYLKSKPDARVLIFDNHAIFGGEARHNEFDVDGYKLWGPQGSTGAVWPPEGAKKIEMYSHLWEELGLPMVFEWQDELLPPSIFRLECLKGPLAITSTMCHLEMWLSWTTQDESTVQSGAIS